MSAQMVRDTLVIEGPDATRYLQGQLSNDVSRLAVGDSCWTFLLEPSGKLGFLGRVRRVGDHRYVLDLERGTAEAAEARLRRFLIRTKVTIEPGSMTVDVESGADGDLVGWWAHGWHRIVTGEPGPSDEARAEAARIRAGWPGAAECTNGVIPGETGVVAMAVSFTKGCYTGQELVARIDSRGNNVPHRLRMVDLTAPASVGDEIVADGAAVGALTSVSDLFGLAYVPRRIEPPMSALVAGRPATIVAQPTSR